MNFEKKLIILSGNDGKGTVNIERSAYGTFVTLNIFCNTDLKYGEYGFGIRHTEGTAVLNVGSLGRIMARHKIKDIPLSELHCFLFNKQSRKVVLYGSTEQKRLWEANLMDGIRREDNEQKENQIAQTESQAMPNYSNRPKEIDNYFFDILPTATRYLDEAVAEVNYYPGNLGMDKASKEAAATYNSYLYGNSTDKTNYHSNKGNYEAEKNNYSSENVNYGTDKNSYPPDNSKLGAQNNTYSKINSVSENSLNGYATSPSQLERQYLYRYRKDVYSQQAQLAAKEMDNEANNKFAETENIIFSAENKPFKSENKNLNAEKNVEKKQQNKAVENNKIILNSNDDSDAITVEPSSKYTADKAVKEKIKPASFYEQTKKQLDELFSLHTRYSELEKLMPSSRWVKVDFDGSGKFYVVGIIGAKPDYICYGVPGDYSPVSPTELDGYCAFVPISPEKPQGKGFWLMFQDAESGASVPGIIF